MKKLIFVLTICVFFTTTSVFGQQPQVGPSNAGGNIYRTGNVGIGGQSASAVLLNIKAQDQTLIDFLGNETSYSPTNFRLEHEDIQGQLRYWDIKSGSNLTFKSGTNPNSLAMRLSIGGTIFDYKGTLLRVGNGENRFNIGNHLAPNGNAGQYIAFGANPVSSNGWQFTGNSTNNGGAVIHGDNQGNLFFITRTTDASNNMNSTQVNQNIKMQIHSNGKISIGTTSTGANTNIDGDDYLLFVTGGTLSDEVTVESGWADYVFEDNYDLLPLEKVAQHIDSYGHLHNTPSAADLNGKVNLGDATVQQQEKIEEIYLHLIEMNKEIKALKAENERLKQEIENLK